MKNISDIEDKKFIHIENTEWVKKLDFYEDKINFFQGELFEVMKSNPEDEKTNSHVENYRMLFIEKTNQIKDLRTRIAESEHHFVSAPEDKTLVPAHHKLRAHMHDWEDNFEVLKINFMKFAADFATPLG
ncbi:MAG TPA: hypothetical protein PLY70_07785 [Saprospiraceae bacterium]|nr:hypothetical protein [Saprospiraceae bacterium]HPN69805.1 hypothetical protein [Saprospiraceae bacterium]